MSTRQDKAGPEEAPWARTPAFKKMSESLRPFGRWRVQFAPCPARGTCELRSKGVGGGRRGRRVVLFSGLHAASSQRETYEIKTKPKLQKLNFIFFSRRYFEALKFNFQKAPPQWEVWVEETDPCVVKSSEGLNAQASFYSWGIGAKAYFKV